MVFMYHQRMGLFKRRHDLPKLLSQLSAAATPVDAMTLAERGIAAALAEGDDDAGFTFRENLLLACCLTGSLHRAIPAMEWCLARCDADPARFDPARVLFQYKWIIEELPRHSAYDAAVIERGLGDLERRFAGAGWGRRGPLELRMRVAWTMRRYDDLAGLFDEWSTLEADPGSDCAACSTAVRVRYLITQGRSQEAIDAAGPLIREEQHCNEEPGQSFARLTYAFADAGRFEELGPIHRRGLELVAEGPQYCEARANHTHFLVLTGNFELAGQMLEIALPQALDGGPDLPLLQTCDVGWLVLEVLRRRRLDMPSLEPSPDRGIRSAGDWAEWMEQQATTLGPIFDRRNGNTAYQDDWAQNQELADRIASAPLE
jgi:hypothetical protein